ncbi:MAG: dimethyl sulfoxide reductase anchor subunit [Gemmatimonadota bacterium]|jgi:anaerobic dimethyl sulfoxide reductase subunit C (anchor subunit)
MNLLHEWPLVLFTLTVQLAVGLLLASLAAKSLLRAGHRAESPVGEGPFLLVGVLMAAALAVSILHLGSPMSAVFSLSNLDESWLSREILAVLVFLGLWGLGYSVRRRPGAAPRMAGALAWATALVGIALIWVMARIYMVPARPLWDHWLTAAGFFLTTLLLGAVAGAAYLECPTGSGAGTPGAASLARPTLLAVGLAASLAQIGATLAHPMTGEIMNAPGGSPLAGLRLLLLLGGASLLAISLARSAFPGGLSSQAGKKGRWASGALLLLGASEVVGRVLFYAAGPVIPF